MDHVEELVLGPVRYLAAALRRALDARPAEVIGFVDLVGYTKLAARMDPSELPELLDRFRHVCSLHVTRTA
jgi:class 3 adenylate cyclase